MSFVCLWEGYKEKQLVFRNPDAKIQMTVERFKEALRLAYEEGRNDGAKDSANPSQDIFNSIFGGKNSKNSS